MKIVVFPLINITVQSDRKGKKEGKCFLLYRGHSNYCSELLELFLQD